MIEVDPAARVHWTVVQADLQFDDYTDPIPPSLQLSLFSHVAAKEDFPEEI
jgi:hypothetical protein